MKEITVDFIPASKDHVDYVYKLLCELENEKLDCNSFLYNFSKNITEKNINYFIIMNDQKNCGFVSLYTQLLLHHNGLVVEIQELIIENTMRNKHIGKQVINKIKQWGKENNIKQIEVCTNKNRKKTQSFYKREEFDETHYKYVYQMEK